MLMEMTVPTSITVDEVSQETTKDLIINDAFKALEDQDWTGPAKIFKPYSLELCRVSDILMRGERKVIPQALQSRILELAHEGHPGIVVMKRRLRQKVWWPGMDRDAEKFAKRCRECILVSAQDPPEPLTRTTMPDKPWAHIAADFMGPLPSGHNLLVLVDYFSRFIEVIVMKDLTAKLTIQAFHETFCRYGIPETLRTDNGPQFVSEALNRFCKEHGIQLLRTTPYWPQANGEVERANRALKKRLQISQINETSDWRWDLRTYLLLYNSTPHSTTGVAPSALMFGRVLRDKLPSLSAVNKGAIEEIQDRDRQQKLVGAEYADNRRHSQPNAIKVGDVVVARRMLRENKLSSNFHPDELEVVERVGSDATLKSSHSGKIFHRNVTHLKRITPRTDEQNVDSGCTTNESATQEEAPEPSKINRPKRDYRTPNYLKEYQLGLVQDH
ncbi:uncharacterized protein K02A2.6-like [Armigeres subalbatus]|uniref:uncharacterized protein K02A2.6-like n=1 Tax=Armigeres subalbatus TaxID=124917 RepID=UPI002ED461F9